MKNYIFIASTIGTIYRKLNSKAAGAVGSSMRNINFKIQKLQQLLVEH
jgi:hypothetical protein